MNIGLCLLIEGLWKNDCSRNSQLIISGVFFTMIFIENYLDRLFKEALEWVGQEPKLTYFKLSLLSLTKAQNH